MSTKDVQDQHIKYYESTGNGDTHLNPTQKAKARGSQVWGVDNLVTVYLKIKPGMIV